MSTPTLTKIVLTGAPSSGKTTIARELAARCPGVIAIPESATAVYSSLGLRWDRLPIEECRSVQRLIYRNQLRVEEALHQRKDGRIFVLDRGTIDGAAYWPDGPAAYWRDLGTTEAAEIARYAMVIVLESSAAIGLYDGDASNQVRFEDAEGALENAKLLGKLWSEHPNTHFVAAHRDLEQKVAAVEQLVRRLVPVGRVG